MVTTPRYGILFVHIAKHIVLYVCLSQRRASAHGIGSAQVNSTQVIVALNYILTTLSTLGPYV